MPDVLFDTGTIRGLGTLLIFVAFIGVVIWAYSARRKPSRSSRRTMADNRVSSPSA